MTESGFNRLQDVIENAGELTRRVALNELVDNLLARNAYNAVFGGA